jgi:uncharacterized protein (TIGR00251 family)
MPITIRQLNSDIWILPVFVTPKSSKNQIIDVTEGDTEIKLKVTAVAEDGKANAAVIQLLSKTLGIAKSNISIHRGETSRHKQIAVKSDSENWITALIQASKTSVDFFKLEADTQTH